MRDRFKGLAPIYETVEACYSGGAIARVKRAHQAYVKPGMRVCYAGVGAGGEVRGALERGAQVTLVDQSQAMLDVLARSLAGLVEPTYICGDVMAWQPEEPFDLLCTHFFLNIYGEGHLSDLLDHLSGWVKPGGLWSVADFRPGKGLLRQAYWFLPLLIASPITGEELHPFYDYRAGLAARGFSCEVLQDQRWGGWGPNVFRFALFRRTGKSSAE